MVLQKEKGKWVLYSKASGRRLGVFSSKEKALKRERQIQYFKHSVKEIKVPR